MAPYPQRWIGYHDFCKGVWFVLKMLPNINQLKIKSKRKCEGVIPMTNVPSILYRVGDVITKYTDAERLKQNWNDSRSKNGWLTK